MLEAVKTLWTTGARGQSPALARQITLTNQIAMLALLTTAPYQVFYIFVDLGYYLPIFAANLVFSGCYVAAILLNRAGRFDLARNTMLCTVCSQVFVATLLLGTGSGVHLFYFALAASVGLIFAMRSEPFLLALLSLTALLFAICQLAFPPGSTPLELPPIAARVMYIGSATGTIFLAGAISILFRIEIENAETALTRSNAELERLSGLDSLTGLANRRSLDDFLGRELSRSWRNGQPVSVILGDVDFFKAYNDHYGHLAGDACLRRVAGAFADVARRGGDLAARFGGEEFALVLTSTDGKDAVEVAERLRRRVRALALPHVRSEVDSVVTVSIGVVSTSPGRRNRPEELLHRADAALYSAKAQGRNRVAAWDRLASAPPSRTPAVAAIERLP